jgi:hypothetical protein
MKTEDPADELFRLRRLLCVVMADSFERMARRMRTVKLAERLRNYLGLRLEGEDV